MNKVEMIGVLQEVNEEELILKVGDNDYFVWDLGFLDPDQLHDKVGKFLKITGYIWNNFTEYVLVMQDFEEVA